MYQFKITLQDVKPAVWRRIQTPTRYSFWDLHVAIQDAMGWRDAHLHEFRVLHPQTRAVESIGIPDDGEFGDDKEMAHCRERSIADYFSLENPTARYIYDFGDDWNHEIVLEEAADPVTTVAHPLCVDGRGNCPPEDCGGPYGYAEFLRAIKKPGSPRGSELLEWVGGGFDPHGFDRAGVVFDDPADRWFWAFEDSILLNNELQDMMAAPRKADRLGRIALRIPGRQYAMILQHPAELDVAVLERLEDSTAKNGMVTLKLDSDDLQLLGKALAATAKKVKKRLDRRIFIALRDHFAALEPTLRGR